MIVNCWSSSQQRHDNAKCLFFNAQISTGYLYSLLLPIYSSDVSSLTSASCDFFIFHTRELPAVSDASSTNRSLGGW